MKSIEILAATYTSKEMGEIDMKTLRMSRAWRYRQDIFPSPDGFRLVVEALEPSLVETGDPIYPYQLKIRVLFGDNNDDARIENYREAIARRVKRFEVVRNPKEAVKPAPVEKDTEKTAPAIEIPEPKPKTSEVVTEVSEPGAEIPEAAAKAVVDKPKRGRKKGNKKK